MNKLGQLFLGFTFMVCVSSVIACPSTNSDCKADKKTWVNHIGSFIPAAFCKNDSPFMQCYEVSQTQCLDISLTVTNQCVIENEKAMPLSFNKEDSIKWGGIIGSCAGDKLTDIIKLKAGKNASCAIEQ